VEPGSQLTLALNENKLQVSKRRDSHITRKKRKKSMSLLFLEEDYEDRGD